MSEQSSELTDQASTTPDQGLSLEAWIEQETGVASRLLRRCISATDLVKVRRGFGQTITPKAGSVLGALQIASYDPDPDYFFHWLRDSSLVMDALRILILDGIIGREGLALFADFLRFSLSLSGLNGAAVLKRGDPRRGVDADFLRYLRPDTELKEVEGDRVLGDVRFNVDGTLDTILWSRPQHDGPALRALTCIRYIPLAEALEDHTRTALRELLRGDLDFTERHWREPCFDLWEEELAHHYYTRLVQSAALEQGAAWADGLGERERAHRYRTAAREARQGLERYWSEEEGFYCSRISLPGGSHESLDIAATLAVLHARLDMGPHSVLDPRAQATLHRLEELFAAEYSINRRGHEGRAPALGRYRGDRYYSGGAYYLATLGAAEFYFRLAQAVREGATIDVMDCNRGFIGQLMGHETGEDRLPSAATGRWVVVEALLRRGDAFMATVRHFTPPSGELSEQFDQATGRQTSGKNLAWSYAAFITARSARRRVMADPDSGRTAKPRFDE